MEIPRSTQFKALQLHTMPPTYHFTIDAARVAKWGESWIRISVSRINALYKIYIQCHKNKDGSLTIWHNPERREQSKSVEFDKLVWLKGQLKEYTQKRLADPNPNAFIHEMLAIQAQIDEVLIALQYKDGEPRKRKGNAIRQPLSVILDFYGLTEEIWLKIPPKLQIKKKIQAEVAIKNRRRTLEEQTQ